MFCKTVVSITKYKLSTKNDHHENENSPEIKIIKAENQKLPVALGVAPTT